MDPERMTDMERVSVSRSLLEALRPAWVQRTFRISHTSLATWRENGIPPGRLPMVLREVRALVDGEHEEAPPPEWARGLSREIVQDVSELILSVFLPEEQRVDAADRLQAFLESRRTPGDEASVEEHPDRGSGHASSR